MKSSRFTVPVVGLLFAALVLSSCSKSATVNDGSVSENENDAYHLAKIFIQEGRFEEAVISLERAAEIRGQRDPEHDIDLAYCHMIMGYRSESETTRREHYNRGLAIAGQAALKRPELADPRAIMGFIRLELSDYPNAIREYRAATSLDATKAKYHWNLAEAYRRTGNRNAAVQSYTAAAIVDSSYAPRVEAKLLEIQGPPPPKAAPEPEAASSDDDDEDDDDDDDEE